jgi:hypothetical protein
LSAASVAVLVLLVGVYVTAFVFIHSWPGVAVGGVQKALDLLGSALGLM